MATSLFRNFFEKKLWPDFNEKDYNKILNKFKKTKTKFWKNLMNNELLKRILSSIIIIPVVLFFIIKGSFLFNLFYFNLFFNFII